MKTLKSIFALLILTITISSCTPQGLDDNQTDTTDIASDTGAEGEVDTDGSKD